MSKRGSGTVKRSGFVRDAAAFASPREAGAAPGSWPSASPWSLPIQPIWLDRVAVAVTGAIALTLVAAARWQLKWLPVVVLVLCGISLRLVGVGQEASDVCRRDGHTRSR